MLKKILNLFFVCFLGMFVSCAYTPKAPYVEKNSATGTFIDERDSITYKTVIIGSQIWMAENLKYNATNSYCYDSDPSKCKYGRLYSWSSARDEQLCPAGWHLPFYEEWEILSDAVGGKEIASQKLRSNKGWGKYNGIDNYHFTVRPSGYRHKDSYEGLYKQAYFWLNGDYSLRRVLPYANGHYLGKCVKHEFGDIGECVEYADPSGNRFNAKQPARGVLMFNHQDSEIKSKLWRVNDLEINVNGKKFDPNDDYADDYWLSVRCISDKQSVTETEEDDE